jgi:hypothetical protein
MKFRIRYINNVILFYTYFQGRSGSDSLSRRSCKIYRPYGRYWVVLAGDKEDLEYMKRTLKETYEKWGLYMDLNKTKYLYIGGTHNNLKLDKDNEI